MKNVKRLWLKELRTRKGLTQLEVAEQAQIERAYYTMIETGQRKPSVAVAKAIAKSIDFEWTIFFEQEGNDLTPKRAAV